jgi:hypothetical protein
MLRWTLVAVALFGCGSSQGGSSVATASPLPRAAECEAFVVPGISNDGMGTECVPPERFEPIESGPRWAENGRPLQAGDCYVLAYEGSDVRDPWLAYRAARSYHEGGRLDLARVYYERVITTSQGAPVAADARRGLAELDAR